MLISPGRSNVGGAIKGGFSQAVFTQQEEGRWQRLLCLVIAVPRVIHRAPAGARAAPCSRNTWSAPLGLARSQHGKAVPQTPPGTLWNEALGYTKSVSPASQTTVGYQCRGKDLLQSWVGFAITVSEGLSAPLAFNCKLSKWQSIDKGNPWPLPWPGAGSRPPTLDTSRWCQISWNQSRTVSWCPGKRKHWFFWMLLRALCCWSRVRLWVVGDKRKQAWGHHALPHAARRLKVRMRGRNNAVIPGM